MLRAIPNYRCPACKRKVKRGQWRYWINNQAIHGACYIKKEDANVQN